MCEIVNAAGMAEAYLDEDLTALRFILDELEDKAGAAMPQNEAEFCYAVAFLKTDLRSLLRTASVVVRDMDTVLSQLRQAIEQEGGAAAPRE